jgi:hypothetical protein
MPRARPNAAAWRPRSRVTTAGATWSSTGAYDADSALVTQKLPGGVTRQVDLDQAGEPVGLRYTGQLTTVNPDGTTSVVPDGGWLAWSQDNDIAGRVVREWTPDGAAFTGPAAEDDPNDPGDAIPYDRGYSYDAAGRLTQVRDRTAAATGIDVLDQASACVTRSYSFDANHNRLARTTTPAAADGSCATTGGSTVSRTFDTADRPVSYVYDALGRILTLPAADAPHPAAGDVTLAYYDNDLARSIVQGWHHDHLHLGRIQPAGHGDGVQRQRLLGDIPALHRRLGQPDVDHPGRHHPPLHRTGR